jgi:hypothetical protein
MADHDISFSSNQTTSASPTRIAVSQSRRPVHAPERLRPLRLSHAMQIAHTRTPPWVNVEQSPQTGA